MLNELQDPHESQLIWLIDRRKHWRKRAHCALLCAGYNVQAWATYDYPPAGISAGKQPDLVLVSSTRVGAEEEALAKRILKLSHPLLMVSGQVPIHLTRTIFRAGARDVVETPPDEERMISLVEQSLLRDSPLSSYEIVTKESRSRQ